MKTLSSKPRPSFRSLTLRAECPHRFLSDDRHRIAISDLRCGASLDVEKARGRSVLIQTDAQLLAVLAALDLDGVASRIVLCPPDQARHALRVVEQAKIDMVIGDHSIDAKLGEPVWPGERDIDTEWVLLTSGTTGLPKLVRHSLSSLAGPLDDGLVASGAVWSTFYDIRRYGGLQMLLRAFLGGGSMILSSKQEPLSEFLRRLGRQGVTHISGTPSHWRLALMSEAIAAISPTYVRLSGEIVDQAILDHLRRTFPDANLGHAFASTEAGVAFDVRDGKAGFPAAYIGSPNIKAELKVEGGTLHIRSARTAKDYIGAALNGSDGWIDTGDLVKRREDRYYFAGRKEGVINVGGQKVYPEEVEMVITQYPAIQMARVWGRKSPVTGALVAADIILKPEANVTLDGIKDDLLDHCRRGLAAWKVPVSVREVPSIALSPAGKIARA